MTKLSFNDLIKNSIVYHELHTINQEDIDLATELHNIIRATRDSSNLMAGDIMICIGPEKEYQNGHIANNDLSYHGAICTQPYVPFAIKMITKIPKVVFDTSGGYWFKIPKDKLSAITYVGTRIKLFKAWGHSGACKNGAFTFECKINVWQYASKSIY